MLLTQVIYGVIIENDKKEQIVKDFLGGM